VNLLNDMKKDLKQFPQAYFQAGDFYARVGQFDNALKQIRGRDSEGFRPEERYLKREIELYIRQGNAVMAQSKNEQILKNDPKDPKPEIAGDVHAR